MKETKIQYMLTNYVKKLLSQTFSTTNMYCFYDGKVSWKKVNKRKF